MDRYIYDSRNCDRSSDRPVCVFGDPEKAPGYQKRRLWLRLQRMFREKQLREQDKGKITVFYWNEAMRYIAII